MYSYMHTPTNRPLHSAQIKKIYMLLFTVGAYPGLCYGDF